jgi:adenine deaminase
MRKRWIAVARGDEAPDLVLSGGSVLSVFTGEVFRADVAIADGHVVGVGEYSGGAEIDVGGKYLVPGFIDGHCHIESSKLNVDEFARAVVPAGTTTVVIDPHEMANVLGVRGIEYMLEASKGLPLGVYVMIPSCVPASEFESPAAPLEAYDFAELLQRQRVIGIAELMDYPSAIAGRSGVLSKMAMTGYRRIDGHAPGVKGRELNAYIVSGPSSDHECTTLEEALEKRRLGMWVMIREASMIRNLVDLLPMVQKHGTENTMFVTDDREAGTLLDEGHMNAIVRKAVKNGLSAGDAVKMASLNVARYHGLQGQGAIAPSYEADILVLPDLAEFRPEMVFKRGELVAENGTARHFESPAVPSEVVSTVHLAPTRGADFCTPASGEGTIRVVDIVRDQVVTAAGTATPTVRDGMIVADPARDLAKLAVVERHHASGRMGKGFVRGFGLQEGAMASTVAHDAHNVVVAGVSDDDMAAAVNHLAEIGGGLAVALKGKVLGDLPLEIGGLMSRLDAASVAGKIAELEAILKRLGIGLETPFMYLSFLALSVIPEMRVTDRGIVDVRTFQVVPLGI